MRDTRKWVKEYPPSAIILENVLGIGDQMEDEEMSPLDMILENLTACGFIAQAFQVCLGDWVDVHRDRTHSEL